MSKRLRVNTQNNNSSSEEDRRKRIFFVPKLFFDVKEGDKMVYVIDFDEKDMFSGRNPTVELYLEHEI